jgi:uncharacterized membrane protein (DUF2068 family)
MTLDSPTSQRPGLKSVALFEAFKGVMVLLIGCGVLALVHQDLQTFGEKLIHHLHLNPARHYPQIFLQALSRMQDFNFLLLAAGAALYSALRFVEAYGLWKDRAWAEWLAILSTGLYLPLEFYELWEHATWIKGVLAFLNLGLLVYLLKVRREKNLAKIPKP